MTEAVDYAFSVPSAAGLAAAGKVAAGRYVGPGTDNKHLQPAERDALFAAGLDVFLLVEGSAGDAMGGWTAGVNFAHQALANAQALGAPADCALYVAVDFQVTAAQWPTVAQHLKGFASVAGLSRTGIYGSYQAMQWAARDKVATWFFQTYAWSAGLWFAGNHIEQYHNGVQVAGGTVDLCRIRQANYGQWSGGAMSDQTAQQVDDLAWTQDAMFNMRDTIVGGRYEGAPAPIVVAIKDIQTRLAALEAGGSGGLVAHTHDGGTTGPAVAG